ncbi:Permease of the drug/metabolite transporter (DMT) superfamily [Candidatus Burkholderia verschuerenii]|uniref:Permease of the drug/metabolite transporter (DMT) superfamily n=1 Tax=Candidatus Burkholderia verschuerenii TaxID=242163 RepID=A0A0L0MHP5_9BURK|nr:DMT family transporter [Candidatus Burkholderia verschuerenii]KND62197.1 Permease of the drug/metabolite transporter (DMT) superfamily [Candidatus Burkholderia verschuerenii]
MSTLALRRAPDTTAVVAMILLCGAWGFQQVAIKEANASIPPILQAGIRSLIATLLVWIWTRTRGIALFQRDDTLPAGLMAGVLFGGEIACIFFGLSLTTATRMAVFLYTAPCFTALGLHWFVAGERLSRVQWSGIVLAFCGIALAFADGFLQGSAASSTWQGVASDALGVLAGLLWGSTTVLVRGSSLAHASASKTLFYQLAVSAVLLLALAAGAGQTHIDALPPLALASLAYQAIVVAFISYLMWFWLLTRYMASRLSVFSFLTPIFGVTFGVLLLGEAFSARFMIAAAMVLAGIALVNRPTRTAASA